MVLFGSLAVCPGLECFAEFCEVLWRCLFFVVCGVFVCLCVCGPVCGRGLVVVLVVLREFDGAVCCNLCESDNKATASTAREVVASTGSLSETLRASKTSPREGGTALSAAPRRAETPDRPGTLVQSLLIPTHVSVSTKANLVPLHVSPLAHAL